MLTSPHIDTTLTGCLDACAQSDDLGLALIAADGAEDVLTYAELRRAALGRLAAFQQRGVMAGSCVVFFLPKPRAFLVGFWACLYGGLVPVPITPGAASQFQRKLYRILAQVDGAWLYTESAVLEGLQAGELGEVGTARCLVEDDPALAPDDEADPVSPAPGDTAFIQFSSGSTSEPKGVVLSHHNLLTNIRASLKGTAATADDRMFSWMPLTHDMGLIGGHLFPLVGGFAQAIMPPEVFGRRPGLWFEKINAHRSTITSSPNFGYKHYMKRMSDADLRHLDLGCVRLIVNGAEPISVELCDRFLSFMAPYGLRRSVMFTVYGLAEATLSATFPEPETAFRYLNLDRRHLRLGEAVRILDQPSGDSIECVCVGRAVEGCELSIRDEDYRELAAGVVGLICLRGDNVTNGYHENPQATREVFRDGWFNTGDLGLVHDGELYVTGRHKEIIFSNGLNVYPHDLEALSGFELGKVAITGVRERGADEDTVLVFLGLPQRREYADTARAVMRAINEATGVVVSKVIPIRRIPTTTSGKIQRRLLGGQYLDGEFDEILREVEPLLAETPASHAPAAGDALAIEIKALADDRLEEFVLGMDDDFFDSGINSLSLAQLHEAIEERYPGLLDITDFFDHPTIRQLAVYLGERLEAGSA